MEPPLPAGQGLHEYITARTQKLPQPQRRYWLLATGYLLPAPGYWPAYGQVAFRARSPPSIGGCAAGPAKSDDRSPMLMAAPNLFATRSHLGSYASSPGFVSSRLTGVRKLVTSCTVTAPGP